MPWTLQTTPPTWNVTDIELLPRLNYHLLENGNADATATPTTTMFTEASYLAVLNTRQQQFLRDTAVVLARSTQGTTPQVFRYTLPSDWITTRRLAWGYVGVGPGPSIPVESFRTLSRTDSYDLDHGMPDWQQNPGDPTVYNDGSDLPTLTVEIARAPSRVGVLNLLYAAEPATLDGSGINLSIPDEMEGAVLWGALSDLLGSDGESHDVERTQFCESMYGMIVDMTNSLLGGPPDQ